MAIPWDVSTAGYENKFCDLRGGGEYPEDVFFSPDGSKMYITTWTLDTIEQYALSTNWDVSTAVYDDKLKSVTTEEIKLQGVFFSPDGTKMYVLGYGSRKVFQYTLSSAWNVSTAAYDTKFKDVSGQDMDSRDVSFKSDGSIMYMSGSVSDDIHQYTLGTNWDVSTAVYDEKILECVDASTLGHHLKADGTKIYVVGRVDDKVYQYTMSTPWDISTATYDEKSFQTRDEDLLPWGVFFKPDGTKMYVLGGTYNRVYQYDLSYKFLQATLSIVENESALSIAESESDLSVLANESALSIVDNDCYLSIAKSESDLSIAENESVLSVYENKSDLSIKE